MNTSLKDIKHQFFTYRNGIIADTLRPLMPCYNVIFGLQVPQLAAIARETERVPELARELWADRGVRESRLLAPYLFSAETMSEDDAVALALDVQTQEEADMLAFRFLKRHSAAASILARLEATAPESSSVRSLRNHLKN